MDREKIIEYYNQYIDEILREYILSYGCAKWLAPSELTLLESKNRIPWHEKKSDKYILRASGDKKELGEDILRYGTYWPIFIREDGVVMMGLHRVESLKLIGSDKEILCVVLNNNHFDSSRIDKPKFEYRNPISIKETEFRIPSNIRIPEDSIKRRDEYILFKTNKWNKSNEYSCFKAQNYRDLMDLLRIVPHWLKDYMYEEETRSERIPTRECINDKEAYKEWINMKNTYL